MSKFSQFVSKAMLKTAKKFDININDMQINVEDKTDELTEEQVKEIIIKENPTIYWSDDRAEHYIMDFPFEVDGKKYWCGSVKISNDLKSMDVKIWATEPKQANTLRNIVKSAATVKEIEEIAKGYEQDLQGLGYKDMKVEPYFAYGKYGFYFNFTREDGKPGQKFTGLDTKNNTKLNLRNAYYDLINRKNWYLKRQAKQATKCAKVTKKAEEIKYGVEYRNMHDGIHHIVITDTENKAKQLLELLAKTLQNETDEQEIQFIWEDINELSTDDIEVDYRETENSNGIYKGIKIINYDEIKPDIWG